MRLFVALFPPEELRREIWKLGERVKGPWRREPPEKLHITIKFIGEVSEERASAIREALGAISMGAFEVELVGTGAFPSRKNPRVLWVGARSQGLVDLFGRVEEALQPLGIPREWRDFTPHLTLGRTRGPVDTTNFFTDTYFGSFVAREFYLVRSYLRPTGSVYEVVEKYALD